MSGAGRICLYGLMMVVISGLFAGAVAAKPSGSGPGNSPNAESCQKDGWENLVRGDGTSFAGKTECTSYAAKGGTLFSAAEAPCLNGGYASYVTSTGYSFSDQSACVTYVRGGGTLRAAPQFTVPGAPIDAGLVRVSDITLNGVATNRITVAPGAGVVLGATVTNTDTACPLCIDWTNVAFRDQQNAGCIGTATRLQGSGPYTDPTDGSLQPASPTTSGSVDLGAAPSLPGVYDVLADPEQQYHCGDAFLARPPTVIAQVRVEVLWTPPPG